MLGNIRRFADRVRRRERIALLLVGVCSAFGFAMGATGGRAYLEQPCSSFHRPASTESLCVDQMSVAAGLEIALAPPPPLELRPLVVVAEVDVALEAGPLRWLCDTPPVSTRGPPLDPDRSIVRLSNQKRQRGVACLHMMRSSSGSS